MKKLTYEEVKAYFEKEGYTLVSKEYKRAIEKLDVICPNGHEYSISINSFKKGYRCTKCTGNRGRWTYDEVKTFIEKEGYQLLSTEYKTNSDKLILKCPKGHEWNVRFADFKSGQRCGHCANKHMATEQVKEYVESQGYKFLSNEYINAKEKYLFQCSCGNIFEKSYDAFHSGQRCPICANKRKVDNQRLPYEQVKNDVESYGYKLISKTYKKAHAKITVECDHGHRYDVTYRNFQNGHRCPICKISKGEKRIMNYLDSHNKDYIYDQPYFDDLLSPIGNPLRPDFILEKDKIWIEYDGEFHYKKYYEEQNFKEIQTHDKIKNEYAKKHGWKLIRIPYWDFDNIEEILEINMNQ